MKKTPLIAWTMAAFLLASCQPLPEKPNIVYILADDLGYGDLSAYGQQHFQTPQIDRLAAGGMQFSMHYSGSTVCAPSRSVLMSGRHTGYTPVRGNREYQPEGQWPLPDSVLTIAEVLQQQGYATGAFGKWGLGFVDTEGSPENQGFDVFYGYNCQRIAHNYYPYYLWYNQKKVMLEGNRDTLENQYAPDLIQEQVLRFIEDHQDQPFFLYYPTPLPHAELKVPERYMKPYRGQFLPEKEYRGTDSGPYYKMGGYGSQAESHAAFAGMIAYLDETVGSVLDKLDELNLSDNTVVFFTSDNGPHKEGGADPDYFDSNGPLRGYKRDLYEGGIRVPLLVSWPGVIAAGSHSDHISAFWDVFPTLCQLAGLDPGDYPTDGISMLPTLTGRGEQQAHDWLYWEFHEMGARVAVLQYPWKGVRYQVNQHPDGPLELYHLVDDPGEQHNVAEQYPEKVRELNELMRSSRIASETFVSKGLDRR